MRINCIPWMDTTVKEDGFVWEDVCLMVSFMREMGHEVRLYGSKDLLDRGTYEDGRFVPSQEAWEVCDCDVLLVHPIIPFRWGGKVSKYDATSMWYIRNTTGKVVLFQDDSYVFPPIRSNAKPRWGEYALDFPLIFATPHRANRTDRLGETVSALCGGKQLTLNITWTNAYAWIQKKGGVPRIEQTTPKADFFYGGATRRNEFRKTFEGLIKEFGAESFWSYGDMVERYGLRDSVREHYGKKKATRDELISLASQCRFSFLPYDRNKDYITPKAIEHGMSNSLVLADERYSTEGLEFKTLNLQDVDAVRRCLEMDEDTRLELVQKQHEMLDAFDFRAKAAEEVDNLERLVETGEYPDGSM